MKFIAEIDVMPLEAILDPQGKAVTQSMGNIGLEAISNVRIGKHITLLVDADSKDAAAEKSSKDKSKVDLYIIKFLYFSNF